MQNFHAAIRGVFQFCAVGYDSGFSLVAPIFCKAFFVAYYTRGWRSNAAFSLNVKQAVIIKFLYEACALYNVYNIKHYTVYVLFIVWLTFKKVFKRSLGAVQV